MCADLTGSIQRESNVIRGKEERMHNVYVCAWIYCSISSVSIIQMLAKLIQYTEVQIREFMVYEAYCHVSAKYVSKKPEINLEEHRKPMLMCRKKANLQSSFKVRGGTITRKRSHIRSESCTNFNSLTSKHIHKH